MQKGIGMEQNILLSIIVPVYNIQEYLPRCVASICAQTYRRLEIILVDDGSTDDTPALCDSLAATDSRIRVIHKENGGSSSARNAGIAAAKGEYYGFIDSDDYIMPQMYELLLGAIKKNHMQIAQIARKEIAENGEELAPICIPPREETLYSSQQFLRELLLHRGDCSFCTKLLSADLFRGRSFPEGVLNEDFNLLVHMLGETEGIVSIPPQMYYVFYRIGSNTRKHTKDEFSRVYGDCVDNADMVFHLVEKYYTGLTPVAMRFGLFQRLEYLLHIPIPQMKADNGQYREVVCYIRKHRGDILCSAFLTKQNKLYLLLLSLAPRSIRRLHKKIKRL